MRVSLALAGSLLAVAASGPLAGCATAVALPAPAADLVRTLEGRGLQLQPYDVGYDRAFDRVDSLAHVGTYLVRGVEPPTRRRTAAVLDVYLFETDAGARAAVFELRRIHEVGALYVDGPLVALSRGQTPGLELALRRRFGPPLDV